MDHIARPAKASAIFGIYMAEGFLTNQALFTNYHTSFPSPVYADIPVISSRYTQNSLPLHTIYYISYKAA
jgi:hypothetical protein